MRPPTSSALKALHQSTCPSRPLKLDFLVPALHTRQRHQSRRVSTTSIPHPPSDSSDAPPPQSPGAPPPHPPPQRAFLSSALRVNQAGELAATLIYAAQTPPIVNRYPHLRPLMKHMYDQEAGHFATFNRLMAKHRIRPTAMYPVWQAAATWLGWS